MCLACSYLNWREEVSAASLARWTELTKELGTKGADASGEFQLAAI